MFPAYLLTDPGFWLFALFYVISVRLITKLSVWSLKKAGTPPTIAKTLPLPVVILFSYLLLEQFFHQAEHVTQMYQFRVLGLAPSSSRGFVWFLDDEWNHFIFNGLYFTGLIVVFTYLLGHLRRIGVPKTFANVGFIYMFFILEGWHMVEHTYRIIHHVQGLCDQCAGIVDTATGIDRLTLHFFFNFAALLLPTVTYAWFGIFSRITPSLQWRKLLPKG